MKSDILDSITTDLLSVPPLIFRGVRRRMLKIARLDTDFNISPLHFEIMALLRDEGTLHVTEIGERLNIAKAQMTHLLDRLVDAGTVARQLDTADRRMTNILLTGKGRATLEEHSRNIRKVIRETLSVLKDEELVDLADALQKMRDILLKVQ